MAWTTQVKAFDGAALVLYYDGEGDPRECKSLRYVNPRTRQVEARRQDPAYPFPWTRVETGDRPDGATHVDLRW